MQQHFLGDFAVPCKPRKIFRKVFENLPKSGQGFADQRDEVGQSDGFDVDGGEEEVGDRVGRIIRIRETEQTSGDGSANVPTRRSD